MTRARHILIVSIAIMIVAGLCHAALAWRGPASSEVASCEHPVPPKPAHCEWVTASGNLQATVDRVTPNTELCLQVGTYEGPLTISKPLTIWGNTSTIIKSQGLGTTVSVNAHNVTLLGFTIDGSGTRYDTDDAALRLQGQNLRAEGLTIRRATYGILFGGADHAVVRNNRIEGDPTLRLGLRGDAIRLWETSHAEVTDNVITHNRDVVVWYSSHNRITGNRIEGGRYGVHLMYSHDNVLEHNALIGNVVGVFVMYSHNVHIDQNEIAEHSSPAGMGVGLKESGNIAMVGNIVRYATTGVFIDSSPFGTDSKDEFRKNAFLGCGEAVVFHGQTRGNAFQDNAFIGALAPVSVENGGDALASKWKQNYFDDYEGYDLDSDGYGDVAYEVRSLSHQLSDEEPLMQFFRGTVAESVIEAAGKLVPMFEPRTLLSDPHPRVRAPAIGGL